MLPRMPSRKLKDPCPKCAFRNTVRSKFCNQCGSSLPPSEPRMPAPGDDMSKQSEHKDIAHPITAECRDYIQKKVLDAYENEKKASPSSVGPNDIDTSVRRASPAGASNSASTGVSPRREMEEDNDIEL